MPCSKSESRVQQKRKQKRNANWQNPSNRALTLLGTRLEINKPEIENPENENIGEHRKKTNSKFNQRR